MWKKFVGISVLAVVAAGGSAFAYLYFRNPSSAPPRKLTVERTPERLTRGKYLYEVVLDCDGCHSVRDFTKLGGPVVAGKRGQGQQMPVNGLPGKVYAPNITADAETGIGAWTDGEKLRAIREGIGKDGRALFPMMPYMGYRYLSDEDAFAVIAYLSTLAPVRNPLPKTALDFPVSMFVKGAPEPVGIVSPPDRTSKTVYGEYLAAIAGCRSCHTPEEKGKPNLSLQFAGGQAFDTQWGVVVSANITPDKATGIGGWDYVRFRDRFRAYAAIDRDNPPSIGRDKFTLMPWLGLSRLTDEDMESLYTYLQTRPPIEHKVETHPVR